MKSKLTELANELNIEFKELHDQAREKVPDELSGRGKNTWITEAGAEEMRLNQDVPEAVPECFKGKVKARMPNRLWVSVVIEGLPGKHPVLIGRRLDPDMLLGKRIPIHKIQDASGVTFRHASLTT